MRQKDLTLYRGDTTSFPFLVSNIDPGDFSSLTIRMEAQRQDTFETVIGFNILSSDPGNNWASNQVQANLTPGMSQGIETDQTILLKYDLEVSRDDGSGVVVTTEYFGTIQFIPDVTVGNPVIDLITEVNIRSDFASTADSLGASLVGVKASLWNSIASNVQQALEWLLNNRLNAPSPWNTNRIIKTGAVAPDTIATGVSIDSSNNITGANRVTSASAPTNPQDLARKDYVDQSTEQFLLSLSPIAGQYLTFDGTNFDFLIPPTAPVTSVNGQTGVVSLDTDDVPEGSRLYFTEERVDDRVNNLLVAGANITLTYNDPSNTLTIAAASGSGSIPNGTAALPGLAFTSDPDTGLYRPGANQIGLVTAGAERFRIEETGKLKAVYESSVGTDYNTTLHNGYLCRAWVNFDGTGTVAIRASGNVSSITDNGTGDYTVNFTTAMPDADYACTFGAQNPLDTNLLYNTFVGIHPGFAPTVSSVRVRTTDTVNQASANVEVSNSDTLIVNMAVFR